jgi:DtxR family Mn-dependent transcriptional regulator
MASNTVEDYLKAIYLLQAKEGRAKTSRLAEQLGLTAGSVTNMLQRLAAARPRLLTYRHHQGVQLTPRGKRQALAANRCCGTSI